MGTDGGVSRRQVEKLAALPLSERRDRLPELGELLSTGGPYVRSRAMELVAELSEEYPAAIAEIVEPVAESLGDDPLSEDAARALGNLAVEDPTAIGGQLPLLVAAIDSGGQVTVHVTRALASIAETNAAVVAQPGIREKLFALLDDDSAAVRTNVTGILGDVAGTDPGAVAEAGDALRERLGDPSPAVQRNAAFALGQLADGSPGDLFAAIDDLCGLLESDDPGVRSAAAHALSAMATAADVDDAAIEQLLERLWVDDPAVRQHAAFVLAELAASEPQILRPHASQLTRGLVDSHPQVRRNLLRALAAIDAEFPGAVDEARSTMSDALRTVDPGDASTEMTRTQLRGLANDDTAPEQLRRAAREALVAPGGDAAGAEVESSEDEERAPDQQQSDAGRECPNCGEQFGPDATFCSVCGTSLE